MSLLLLLCFGLWLMFIDQYCVGGPVADVYRSVMCWWACCDVYRSVVSWWACCDVWPVAMFIDQ